MDVNSRLVSSVFHALDTGIADCTACETSLGMTKVV